MRFFIISACLLALSGCSSDPDVDVQYLQDTVSTYTRLLKESYQGMNMAPLATIATTRKVEKAYYHMAALGEGRVRVEMQLKGMTFGAVDQTIEGKADVRTNEKWYCEYYNIDNSNLISTNVFTYELMYHLMIREGRWLVDDITILQSSETNKNSGLHFYQRPE